MNRIVLALLSQRWLPDFLRELLFTLHTKLSNTGFLWVVRNSKGEVIGRCSDERACQVLILLDKVEHKGETYTYSLELKGPWQ